jgi:hypothetical protein
MKASIEALYDRIPNLTIVDLRMNYNAGSLRTLYTICSAIKRTTLGDGVLAKSLFVSKSVNAVPQFGRPKIL